MKRILTFLLVALALAMSRNLAAQQADTVNAGALPLKSVAAAKAGNLVAATSGIPILRSSRTKLKRSMMGIRARSEDLTAPPPGPFTVGPATKSEMKRADSVQIDLRLLPQIPPNRVERPERQRPPVVPVPLQTDVLPPSPGLPTVPVLRSSAPSPSATFDGLDFANWGAGHPPDTNGDAGPTYYIQTINTSIGVYRKSDGVRVAAFTFNTLMSQGHFGNLCDTDNFGDPVVLYDSFEDRWIITDFAFRVDGSDNVINPPGSFQCFAASMTGDPVNGGWNFYSINTAGGLGDYPKFGIWPDGLYMMANMFDYAASGFFQNTRMYALNKAQMYAGKPSIQVVSFDAPVNEFTILPANARLQAGTPPPGAPNYCVTVGNFTNAVSIYKFHVDWNRLTTSSFTGPFNSAAPTSWADAPATVPEQSGNPLDSLADEPMMQNQYTNQSGVESLWLSHTVQGSGGASTAAPRYYQVGVSGGTVAANTTQAFTHTPDATMNRFMPSVAVDRAGDMALGYSTTSSSSFPAIKYAGRLATDPVNTLPQTEVSLMNGAGSQVGSCSGTCERWGDYSAMTLDPDGCRFWYTNEYYATSGLNFLTRIGSFAFPSCTPVGAGGTLQGTVTATAGGAPLGGVSVAFGARSATTNGAGFYSFPGIPAGTYPSVMVSKPGYASQSAAPIVMTDGGTTAKDFALNTAAASGCLIDTTQADFQTGVPTGVDLVTSPGDVVLANAPPNLDQQNTSVSTNIPFDSTTWFGQTFTAGITGQLTGVDLDMLCGGCTGTTPTITVAIRAVTGSVSTSLPTGPDLATATIPGFNSSSAGFRGVTFLSPVNVTAGTQYALVVRASSNPSAGTYEYVISSGDVYAGGRRTTSTDSGGTWLGTNRDIGFRTYFKLSPNFVSGLKDSNPSAGLTPVWSALSWTATTPAGTSIQFQVAGSNSDSGPFNFVGPDGTSATLFTTSGVSLRQFNGLRYLEYKAYLLTSNASSPTLSDVTICFSMIDCSGAPPATITPSAPSVCANSTGNTASGPAGATSYIWSITNGTMTGGATSQTVTYTAGASGTVGLTLNVIDATGCPKVATANVAINVLPTVTPSSLSDGTVGVAYTVTFGSTGGTGSITFGVSGSVPPGLNFSSGMLSGTPTTPGTYTITVTATDGNSCGGSRNYTFNIATAAGTAPANMTATATNLTQVVLAWTPVASATSYDVLRKAPGGGLAVIASPTSNGYLDTQGLVSGTTYIYQVRAVGSGFPGTLSVPDVATTMVFTDDPLVAGTTLVKAIHLTELRTAVNAVRNAAGLTAATFTDAAPAGVNIQALHIQELRSALDPARSVIGVPAMSYANPATAGTIVRAVDLTEIRNGVK